MSDAKPWMVGESPSRTGDRYWRLPLSGAPARTLCQAAGWEPDGPPSELGSWTWALYGRFETHNVFQRYADATPWTVGAARFRGVWLVEGMHRDRVRRAVLLGRKVAAAFGVGDEPYFRWVDRAGVLLVVVPHPSGRNLVLNDPGVRDALGRTLREAVGEDSLSAPRR